MIRPIQYLVYQNINAHCKSSIKNLYYLNVFTATSYVAATGGALATALGLNSLVKHSPPLIGRFVPFCAVAAANCVNIPLMRQLELKNGNLACFAIFIVQKVLILHSITVQIHLIYSLIAALRNPTNNRSRGETWSQFHHCGSTRHLHGHNIQDRHGFPGNASFANIHGQARKKRRLGKVCIH